MIWLTYWFLYAQFKSQQLKLQTTSYKLQILAVDFLSFLLYKQYELIKKELLY